MYSDDEQSDNEYALYPIGNESEVDANKPRRKIRSIIFHLLYAMDSNSYEVSLESIVYNFRHGFDLPIAPGDEACITAQAVITARDQLDQTYIPFLENWRFERLSTITMLILRFAVWELLNTETSPNIIINEAVELAKCFAEDDAYRFINGILDQVAKAHGRPLNAPEIDSSNTPPSSDLK